VTMRRTHRTHRRRQAGFTLIEMMVALAIGALVIAAVFMLGGASARHFQEQQRVGVTQRSVRMAMSRLTRDVQLAGYMHVPSEQAPTVNRCPTPALPRTVPAIWMADGDPTGNAALDSVNRALNGVSADQLRLIGNFNTADQYLIDSVNRGGNTLFLQERWLSFQRNFTVPTTGGSRTADVQRFNATFAPGRMLHLETATRQHIFVTVSSAAIDSTARNATVTITPALGANNPCLAGLGRGTLVSPLSEIRYQIQAAPAGSTTAPRSANVVGPNTQLVREELNMGDGTVIAGTRRTVLEYAIDFNIDAWVDTSPPTLPPNIVRQNGAAAQATIQARPWQVRSLVVSLAARTPEQDRRFPWTYTGGRAATDPLNRFRVFTDRDGAARVRQITVDIQTPNLVPAQ